jgi:hypothetical protein
MTISGTPFPYGGLRLENGSGNATLAVAKAMRFLCSKSIEQFRTAMPQNSLSS